MRDALLSVFGPTFTDAWLFVMTHALLEETSSTAPKLVSREGVPYTPPRTARVPLAGSPKRSEESAPVRAAAIVLLSIAVHVVPGKTRVCSADLYTGDPTGKQWCGLAAHARRSTREIDRYLAAWRTHACGPVAWQLPSDTEGVVKSRKGRCYNVYEFGTIPRELAEIAQTWADSLAKQERAQVRQLASAPAPAPSRTPAAGSSGSALASELLKRLGVAGADPPAS